MELVLLAGLRARGLCGPAVGADRRLLQLRMLRGAADVRRAVLGRGVELGGRNVQMAEIGRVFVFQLHDVFLLLQGASCCTLSRSAFQGAVRGYEHYNHTLIFVKYLALFL